MTIWFDVEDLFRFVQIGNRRASGIQRLCLEIYRALIALDGAVELRFVRHGTQANFFVPIAWSEIVAEFEAPEARPAWRAKPTGSGPAEGHGAQGPVVTVGRERMARLPGAVPLASAAVTQLQAVQAMGLFGKNLLAHAPAALRPRRRASSRAGKPGDRFEQQAKPGDTLLMFGALWFDQGFDAVARWLRDDRRMRVGVLVHDLVPIRRPEWAPPRQSRMFEDWYRDMLPFCDLVLANSRHTATDVEAYARESGIALPGPVRVLPIGTGFGPVQAVPANPTPVSANEYVLFVSTMEPRKNHALAVRIWTMLLDQVKAGKRDAASIPDLVFVGRVGWHVKDLLQSLDNTDWLGGRIRMVQDASDDALRALYQGCLFTFFPSFSEGWGLPVTESLALGKPCLTSDAGALPESGGALCRYFDPENLQAAFQAVAAVLDDRPGLAAWEAQVRRDFRPVDWTQTAQCLLDAVGAQAP